MVVYAALRDRLLVVREGAEPESSERVGVDGDTLSPFVEGTAVTDVSRGEAWKCQCELVGNANVNPWETPV